MLPGLWKGFWLLTRNNWKLESFSFGILKYMAFQIMLLYFNGIS